MNKYKRPFNFLTVFFSFSWYEITSDMVAMYLVLQVEDSPIFMISDLLSVFLFTQMKLMVIKEANQRRSSDRFFKKS